MIKIGPYDLFAVETGFFRLDGGAMFGTVPRVLWEKEHPADEQNRIRLAMRALLIRDEKRRILVDCGLGDKGGEKFVERFAVEQQGISLESSLGRLGLGREDITDVILTHLHFDHAGGATRKHGAEFEPTFPNATYHLQRRNLETARRPNAREKASYLPEIYECLVREKRFRLIDGGRTLFPGIETWVSEGHTEAQQLVKVGDEEKVLLYGGDLIPTHSHIPLPWIMGYDLHPLTMMDEKETILTQAATERWMLFYEHDPNVVGSYVRTDGKGFVAEGSVSP